MNKKKLLEQKLTAEEIGNNRQAAPLTPLKTGLLLAIWLISALLISKVATVVAADIYFARGTNSGDLMALLKAVELNGGEAAYHRNLGLAYAVAAKNEADPTLQSQIAVLANQELKTAVALNSHNLLTLKAAAVGYEEIGAILPDYLKEAKEITKQLTLLSPTDPSLWYEAAKVEMLLGNKEQSKEYYYQTLVLKNDPTAFPPFELL